MTERDMELFRDIQEQALQVKLHIWVKQSRIANRSECMVGRPRVERTRRQMCFVQMCRAPCCGIPF